MAKPPSVAEEALKKISKHIECSVCLDTYTTPKLLPCFHVFCKQCLERMVVQDRDGLRLCCPNCRQSTLLPPNGISGLQSAFHISNLVEIQDTLTKAREPQKTQCEKCRKVTAAGYCRDCGKFVCDKCIEVHQTWEEFTTHRIATLADIQADATNLTPPKKVTYCQKHPDSVLKIYCETCRVLICNDCIVRLHQGHQYDLVTDTFSKHKQEIVSSLKPIKEHLTTTNLAIQALNTRTKDITNQRDEIEADIHKQVKELHQALDMRRTELIGELHQVTQMKLKSLAAQSDRVELLHTQFSSCLEYVDGSLKTGSEEEILANKAPVIKQVEQIAAAFDPSALVPVEEADLFLNMHDASALKEHCQHFAQIRTSTADPGKCYATGDGLKSAVANEHAIVTVQAVDKDDQECPVPIQELTADLICSKDGSQAKCEVEREGRSKCMVKYQPGTRGKYQLHIKINGKDIQRSPFSLLVRPSVHTLRKPVRILGDLKHPIGIATNKKGHFIAIENKGRCVSTFTPEGESFGHKRLAGRQLNSPHGTTVDNDDSIFVADHQNHRILKLSSTGHIIKSVGSQGSGPSQFSYPTGIGFNSKNNKLYVCDHCNHRIQVFDNKLIFSASFGRKGNGNGEFKNPGHLASDSSGNVYITDYNNHRVQVFTPEGQFLRKFGSYGADGGQLMVPVGIAIDSSDTVYVTERDNYRVSMFTTEGKFLGKFGSKGTAEGQFDQPMGIAVDENGYIFVSDSFNNRIQIF